MDQELRRLERLYQLQRSDESLYNYHRYLVITERAVFPNSFAEVEALEALGPGCLPIITAALRKYIASPNREQYQSVVYHLITTIKRLGDESEIFIIKDALNLVSTFPHARDAGNGWHGIYRQLRDADDWLRIKKSCSFTFETTTWELLKKSPHITEIVVGESNHVINHTYYARKFGSYQQDPEIPYSVSIYEMEPFYSLGHWRYSLPGYGGEGSNLLSALTSGLHWGFSCRFQGRAWGSRDTVPPELRPKQLVLMLTQDAVNVLEATKLRHRYVYHPGRETELVWGGDPSVFNFLFQSVENIAG